VNRSSGVNGAFIDVVPGMPRLRVPSHGNARAFRTSKELFADSPHLAMPGATVEVMEITSM
jgi:hypothetical protein